MDQNDLSITGYLIGGPDDATEDVASAIARLNVRLRDVGTVLAPPSVSAPPGTRAGEVAEFAAICVAVAPIAPSLVAALKIILEWRGPRGRRVKITGPDGSVLEADNLSEADQQRIVESWIKPEQQPGE